MLVQIHTPNNKAKNSGVVVWQTRLVGDDVLCGRPHFHCCSPGVASQEYVWLELLLLHLRLWCCVAFNVVLALRVARERRLATQTSLPLLDIQDPDVLSLLSELLHLARS